MEYSNLDEKHAMRVQLTKLIEDWNASRLDLFALCEPNEELEFHGVMRFYFQDSGQKMATKCIRVSSTATTRAVIEALIEKFHADLRLLSTPSYSLWEVHENGEKRKLLADEKPLLVQLNWHKDDREGRFLLQMDKADQQPNMLPVEAIENGTTSMRRKLSKRESKKLEKQQKMNQIREAEDVTKLLYSAVPNTNFTRTISNPEIVMKKRRERKLEQKLKDLGEGGSLKIYGEELSETKPYVTLLLSLRDRADKVVRETLEKYGLDRHCSDEFCLVQLCTNEQGDIFERILDKDDCPLLILAQEGNESNCVTFHVRRKPSTLSRSTVGFTGAAGRIADGPRPPAQPEQHNNKLDTLPYLLEINPDGSEPAGASRIFVIRPNVTEVGSDRTFTKPGVQALCLYGPHVHPRHCVIAFMDGLTTLTPCDATAEITVDDVSITETTILKQNNLIRIGGIHLFRFYETGGENMNSVHAEAFMKPNNHNSINDNNASYGSVIGSGRNKFYSHFTKADPLRCLIMTPKIIRCALFKAAKGKVVIHSGGDLLTSGILRILLQQGDFCFAVVFCFVFIDLANCNSTVCVGDEMKLWTLFSAADSNINDMERILHPARGMSPRAQELATNAKFLARTSSNLEDVIPALFEFSNNVEDDLLKAIICELIPSNVSFKLTPAYMLYMCCRYRIVRHLDVGRSWNACSSSLNCFLTKTSRMINETVQAHCQDAGALAFWMSNLAEALNFLKLDVDLAACSSPEPQGSMADLIQKAFDHLTVCLKQDLHTAMPPILDPQALDQAATEPCLHVLNCVMNLLRVNRVNAALTIQLFSQLFHYINMYLFNWLISSEGSVYCCRRWGIKLRSRLSYVLAWAEKQGLELAAECRLVRILEASQLLQLDFKRGFTKLNSLQTASLLERYIPEADEPPLDRETVTALIQFAEREVDRCQSYEHVPLQLEEEIDLLLPFLIPDDGYSPEMVRGIPAGLQDFANSLAQRGFGQLLIQPTSSGSWAVHFSGDSLFDIPQYHKMHNSNLTSMMMNNSGDVAGHNRQAFTGTRLIEKMGAIPTPLLLLQKRQNSVNRSSESDTTGPHLMFVSFEKGSNGIGLSIVQAQGNEDQMPGIYVKKVVPGSAAAQDGRLQAGDQLLKVNGQSLIGVSQECAAQMMSQSGQVVNFEVAKGAALYNGLAQWIYQLSPDNRYQQQQQQQQMHPVANSPIIYSPHTNNASPVRRHVVGETVPSQPASNRTNNGNNYRYSTSDIHHGRRLVKQFQQPPVSNSRFHSTIGQQMGRSGRSLSASSLLHEMQMERSLGRGRTDSVPSSPAFSSRSDRVFHNAKMIPNPTSGVTKHHQTSADGTAIAAGYNPIVRQSVGSRRSAGSQQIYSHETQSSPQQQHTLNKNYANYNQVVDTTRQSPRSNLPQPQTADFYGSAQQKQTIANGGVGVSSSIQQLPPPAQLSQRPPSRSDLYSAPIMMSDQNSKSRLIPCLENGTQSNPYPADFLEPNEMDREDLEQQVDSEMEKLMRDELARLQSKSSLTAAEQRRYRALRYELEFRRRLSNSSHADDNHYQQIYDPNQQQQHNNYSKSYELDMSHRGNSFNVPVQSASGNSDTSALNEAACARRQQQRDLYFEDAERRYQQIAAKEWNRTQQKDSPITGGRLGQAAVKNVITAEPVANGRGAWHNLDSKMLQTESQMKNLSVTANGGNRMMDSNLKASSSLAENTTNIRKMTPVTTSRPQVQFDTAPPAVYHVETLDDDQRFLDFVTSTSETRPVSNELEQMITSSDGSSTSEQHHHFPTVHAAESRYVYQMHEETPRVIGNQEVYKDPRQERLKHLKPNNSQVEGEKLSFRDKMKLFAKEINESTPKPATIEEFLRIHQNCTDHEIVEYTRERWSTKYANYNFSVL
ncbi:Afadin [Trichinella sp. T6]|nr:Afadin [Trichinella sp. T6]